MNSKITYHQQVSYCGKPRCRKCREGTGHGPYWYAYQMVDGRTTRTYVGKHLPPEAQASVEGLREVPVSPHASEQEHAIIRIYVLGQFRLERRTGPGPADWQTVTDPSWQHQRVRALLGCLVSSSGSGGRKLGREQIMDALWPDLDIETSASRLDRAVYSLRQLFEPGRNRPATSPLLLTEREVLVLADQSLVWIDADAFEQLLTQARARIQSDPGEAERLLEKAAALYGGDFLPEERRVEWTLARRESLLRSWIGALLDLSDLRGSRNALNSAIEPLDRLLSIDPTNEAAVQRLIKLLEQLGRRGEALRAYKRLAAVLQQEYRIAPLPETRALYESLRAGGLRTGEALSTEVTSLGRQAATSRELRGDSERVVPVVQIGRSHQSPLVGREEELKLLRDMLTTTEQAAKFRLTAQKKTMTSAFDTQRRPQCMLVMGDVGIGKTRLAEEVSREAKRRNWAVAWSRVYAQEGSIPYRLWIEVLRKAMEQCLWQRQELTRRPLAFQPLSSLLPELQDILPPVNFPSTQSPEQEQLRLWESVRELLLLISESTPLLIALDDLQWADGSSCELLAYLARRIPNHPIIIVGTCRDNEMASGHMLKSLLIDLQREHAVDTVPLQPLNDEQIGTLVTHSLHTPHVSEPLVQRIRNRAAGNPFFAEELARTVGAQISAHDSNGSNGNAPGLLPYELTPIDFGEGQLPDTIAAVLDLRLARLSSACHRLLSKAAVLGGSFEFQVISAMEANVPGSDEDTVLELLEEGLKSGMLTEEGTGTRVTYQFWHPLLVSHLYEKLSAARRASQHRRAAEVFQRVYQNREEEGAATITHHLVEGGADPQQIVRFAELAGNKAYNVSAYPDAEKYYRIAVEYLDINFGEQAKLAYLLEVLGECARVQGKYEEERHFYERALEVHSHLDKSDVDVLQETQLQAMLLCQIGVSWYDVFNMAQAQKYYQRSEKILLDAGIVAGPAWAFLRLWQSRLRWREGNYEKARTTAYEALSLFEKVMEEHKHSAEFATSRSILRHTLAGDPVDLGRTHMLLGLIANGAGQWTEALSHLNMALTVHEQYDNKREISVVCCNLGDLYIRKSEHSQAQAVLRRSLNLAEYIGDLPHVSFGFGNLGILGIRTGSLSEAEVELRQGIAVAERINDSALLSVWCVYLATALQEQGKLSEAGSVLHRALAITRELYIAPYIGLALVALGGLRIAQSVAVDERDKHDSTEKNRLLRRAKVTLSHVHSLEGIEAEMRTEGQLGLAQANLLLGELDAALQQATQTLEEARQLEQTWLIARAQRLLGCILVAQNQKEQAEQYFEQAQRTFRRCGMRLEHARTLYAHGEMLVQQAGVDEKEFNRGWGYLQEARRMFADCGAALDEQLVERVLARYGQGSRV